MLQVRGQGANTALLGVWDLAEALFRLDAGKTGTAEEALKDYEAEMIPRGRKNLVASSSAFTKDAKSYAKELAERYGRDGQRTMDSK
jgi:2-polyprenyl-6-methoxyphenol hydroxylase-like FAD-dependent oxidoreductase